MTPEALALCSQMTGRTITSWHDLTGIEIEACLNNWARTVDGIGAVLEDARYTHLHKVIGAIPR